MTPFNLTTPDGETLYCWHILPLDVYAEHEREITAQPSGPADELTKTVGYKLLKADPKSRVIINCTLFPLPLKHPANQTPQSTA